MKAYRVESSGFPDGVCCHETAAKAKTFVAYELMDCYNRTFIEAVRMIRVKRCPEKDLWAVQQSRPRLVSPEYAEAIA